MMDLSEFYLYLPSRIQNIALSVYGFNEYKKRFGLGVPVEYESILSVVTPSTKEGEEQDLLLNRMLLHAATSVPFYREELDKKGVSKKHELNSQNFTELLPIVTKQDILKSPEKFVTENKSYLKKRFTLSTSGSTGTPLKIVTTGEARRVNYFYYNLLLREYGLNYRSKSTTFAGRVLYRTVSSGVARYDFYNSTQYLSSYFLSEDTVKKYLQSLNHWKPDFIDSYPSILYQFVNLCDQLNIRPTFVPKLIVTSSETLSDEVRATIERFFSAPVVDHYGCTEMAVSAFSVGGLYYMDPLFAKVEFQHLEQNIYRLISTNLFNYAMPLIRYDVGDTVVIDDPAYPYAFKSVEGRIDDLVVTPEGKRIGRMDPCFKGIEGVKFSQVVQHALDEIEIIIVLDGDRADSFKSEKLVNNFKVRTSDKIRFRITYVDDIDKGANGKFKSVVSLVKQP